VCKRDFRFATLPPSCARHPTDATGADLQLEQLDPEAFCFLMGFARDNELKIRPGRKEQRREEFAASPTANS
jgi:hypothetical protein